jgi:prevent-host-death family protein
MVTVGVRELKQQASELVRRVRETGEEIQVTYHGEVVALLIPVKQAKNNDKAWAKLDRLAAEIGARWPKDVPAAKAVSEARR